MGYDETLRGFKRYLAMPEELNSIRRVARDHVDVIYSGVVFGGSTCLEYVVGDASVGNLEFVEQRENPETMQCILEDFKRSFTQEQTIPVDYPSQEVPVVALPRLRVRAKRV